MPTLIAYVLTLVLIPVVGGLMFLLTMPLMAALVDYSKAYFFVTQTLASAARCAAAWAVFHLLGEPFGIGPMLLVGVVMAAINIGRVKESLNAYAGRLSELGLHTGSDAAALSAVRLIDDQFRTLHGEVGDAIAGLIGGLAGVAVAIAVWASMVQPV